MHLSGRELRRRTYELSWWVVRVTVISWLWTCERFPQVGTPSSLCYSSKLQKTSACWGLSTQRDAESSATALISRAFEIKRRRLSSPSTSRSSASAADFDDTRSTLRHEGGGLRGSRARPVRGRSGQHRWLHSSVTIVGLGSRMAECHSKTSFAVEIAVRGQFAYTRRPIFEPALVLLTEKSN
jgi:hypothetical protein